MDRRRFVKVGVAGVLGVAFTPAFTFAADQESDTVIPKVPLAQFDGLGISPPKISIQNPQGVLVTFEAQPLIIRRSDNYLYVYFELSKQIDIYTLDGHRVDNISLPNNINRVVDFTVDAEKQLIYVVGRQLSTIDQLSFDGTHLMTIGELAYDAPNRVNGIKSLELNSSGNIVVLCGMRQQQFEYTSSGVLINVSRVANNVFL